ncbi:protein kintoun [Oncorhynchus nerka]|uniref:protein kintoun n=1 Tax=Oncorhynchus nerka TaxID=8023 RepID=UPI0031B85544
MEFGSKLKDLNMTPDEMGRFTKAFQNEEFRKMLHEYAEEISKPENKKKYEEEIKLLEQERGVDIQFVHPKPYRALKTSMDGRQKCFINVCSNDMIRKPEFRRVDEAGRVGQHWSLPHSLTPGTPDRDAKGNKYTIYDVVFHPDTIHMAGNNPRFMEMVDNTAVEAVENGGKVKLDKNNVRVLKIKYKGTLHAAVMRKPLPGQPAKEKPSPLDNHLSFPYPDEKQPDTATNQKESPILKAEIQSDTQISQRQQNVNSPKKPTKPHYTLKYRSFIDLQDFRCSRDSAQSPRPKEIVITIDLPLLRSVADADLDVTERLVSLESKKPAYRLEVPMAYPVDENKGEAKFNKQKKQLVVTLPVLPLKEPIVAEVSGWQLVNDDGEEDFEDSCVSAAQSEDATRGKVDTPYHNGLGKEDTPYHSGRGKEDTPDHNGRGIEDTPDHNGRGIEDTPDHNGRGIEDTPDHNGRGIEDTPDYNGRGKEDTPDHNGLGKEDTPDYSGRGIEDTPDYSGRGIEDTPDYSGRGIEDTSDYSGRGIEDTPDYSGRGIEDTPYHSGRGKEDTPDHNGRGIEDTPDHNGRGIEDTPDHNGRGIEDTPDHNGRGIEDTPDYNGRGIEDTPNHNGLGIEDTPNHNGLGIEDTPDHNGKEDTPDHNGLGIEDTPDHNGRGIEDTPDHNVKEDTPTTTSKKIPRPQRQRRYPDHNGLGKEDTPDYSGRGIEDTPDYSGRGIEDTPDYSGRGIEDTSDYSGRGKEDTPDYSGCNEGDISEDVHSGNATSLRSENQLISVLEDKIEFSEQSGDIEEDKQHKLKSGESHQAKASEPTEFDGKTGCTDQNEGQSDDNNLHDEVETDPSSLSERIDDPSNTAPMVIPSNLDNNDQAKDCSSPKIEEIVESQAPTKIKQKTVQFSEHVEVAQSQEEDDLPAEQTFQDCNMRPQQVLLTEINQHGQEVVICDHTTSAGFVFQNSFIYDLD